MLKIAVPNKGALAAPAAAMLRESGYRQRDSDRDLVCLDHANAVEFFYLRPKDIATYVGSGDLDLGITGQDLLIDAGSPAREIKALGFGGSTFRFAAKPGTAQSIADIAGLRVATAYPGVVGRFLAEHGLIAEVIRLDGAVENAIRLGVADVVADVVSTGATLRQAGLELIGDPILHSEATLIAHPGVAEDPLILPLVRRLEGVLVARQYVMLAYDVPTDALEKACTITPGIESPTISPLAREGWVAVQAMTPRDGLHQVMDELYDVGGRGIIVTDIHATRL